MRFNEVDIEVKHSGLLEVPAGKEVDQLPQSHFQKLIDKKGYEAIIRGLTNLEVWNKNKNPKLSQWASNMADKLKVANKKDESYSDKLFEANAKLVNKLGKKAVSGLKKAGDFAKYNLAKSGETARNAIVAGAVAPVGAGIASKISTKDTKKKEPRYTAAEVAALATAMRAKQESLSQKLISHLDLLEKKEDKEESGIKKVAKGAAVGAGSGLALGGSSGAALGNTATKLLTGGLKGTVAPGMLGKTIKGVRTIGTVGGAVTGGAFGSTRGAVSGAIVGGAKHLYDKYKNSKKHESLIEALNRLVAIYEENEPRKRKPLTPEQKARRQERRRLRRQLEKQGIIQKKPRSGPVKVIQGNQVFSQKAMDNAKSAVKSTDKPQATQAKPQATQATQATQTTQAKPQATQAKPQATQAKPQAKPSTNTKALGKANKVIKHSQALRKVLNKAAFRGGLTGAAITAGAGAAGLAAKKIYDRNKKK